MQMKHFATKWWIQNLSIIINKRLSYCFWMHYIRSSCLQTFSRICNHLLLFWKSTSPWRPPRLPIPTISLKNLRRWLSNGHINVEPQSLQRGWYHCHFTKNEVFHQGFPNSGNGYGWIRKFAGGGEIFDNSNLFQS